MSGGICDDPNECIRGAFLEVATAIYVFDRWGAETSKKEWEPWVERCKAASHVLNTMTTIYGADYVRNIIDKKQEG